MARWCLNQSLLTSAVKTRLARGVRQVLVRWKGTSPASATWEDVDTFTARYPQFQLDDVLPREKGRDVMWGRTYTRRRRTREVRRAAEGVEHLVKEKATKVAKREIRRFDCCLLLLVLKFRKDCWAKGHIYPVPQGEE